MSNPRVNVCPVMEAVAASMFGIENVPVKYQKRMVTKAAKEAHKIYSELEKERDELRALAKDEAIEFAEWLEKLKPTQRVSAWSKCGQSRGLFEMDLDQLFDRFKREGGWE